MTLRRWFAERIGPGLGLVGTQRIIAIGFSLVLVFMLLLAGLGLSHMATLKARMVKLVSESNVKAESVFQMRSVSRERFASLGQMVVLQDPFERDDEYMRFQAQASAFIVARERLLGLDMSAEEQAIWARARQLIQRDEELHAQVIEHAMAGRRDAAMGVLLRDVRPLENTLLEAFNEMVEQYRRSNQQALRASEADYRQAAAYMVGLAGLALAMGLAIAWVVVLRSRQAESELTQQSRAAIEAAEKLSWAASHDSLTGLANRRETQRRLDALVQAAQNHGAQHVLLYVDLDKFKVVNDSCGHVAGDELLRQLAGIFTRHVRTGDLVARLGGDEFLVGLANCEVEMARQIAEAIRDAVANYRFVWEGQAFQVGASVGLVPLAPTMDAAAALRAADTACYQAKARGRNQVCVFDGS